MDWLNNPEKLLKMHDQLDRVIGEIDDDELVPDRYDSNLAAILAEHDSRVLTEASRVLHRLFLNSKYQSLDELRANYVKFNQEVTSG